MLRHRLYGSWTDRFLATTSFVCRLRQLIPMLLAVRVLSKVAEAALPHEVRPQIEAACPGLLPRPDVPTDQDSGDECASNTYRCERGRSLDGGAPYDRPSEECYQDGSEGRTVPNESYCVSQPPIPELIIASQAICLEPELPVICGIEVRKTCLYRGCCPVSAGNSLTLKREHVGPDFKLVGIVFVTDQLSTTAFCGHLKSDR